MNSSILPRATMMQLKIGKIGNTTEFITALTGLA